MKSRKLFCEISPTTYKISVWCHRRKRAFRDMVSPLRFAETFSREPLPVRIYEHKSLIRRKLGNVEMHLQDNKAVNLALTAPKISGVLIYPGETFSFFRLAGPCRKQDGYQEGLIIVNGAVASGTGGGLCQFTNLLHWLALHTPLTITERHHHDAYDLFPDFGRQVPFGCGTSIFYNYLDYRLTNNTQQVFQLLIETTDTHLCGEILADEPLPMAYHIRVEDEYFSKELGIVYRNNKIIRDSVDKRTGNTVDSEMIQQSHAKVMYDPAGLPIRAEAE